MRPIQDGRRVPRERPSFFSRERAAFFRGPARATVAHMSVHPLGQFGESTEETQFPTRSTRASVDAKRFQSLQVEASGSGSLRRTMGPIRSVGEELWTKTGGAFGRIRPMRM